MIFLFPCHTKLSLSLSLSLSRSASSIFMRLRITSLYLLVGKTPHLSPRCIAVLLRFVLLSLSHNRTPAQTFVDRRVFVVRRCCDHCRFILVRLDAKFTPNEDCLTSMHCWGIFSKLGRRGCFSNKLPFISWHRTYCSFLLSFPLQVLLFYKRCNCCLDADCCQSSSRNIRGGCMKG
ncbi:unnamed protein product [Camellia sinensis]